MSQSDFGAGVFDDSKPQTPSRPQTQEAPPMTAPASIPAPAPALENDATEDPVTSEFVLQQERDREKAMLLRRTRSEGNPEAQETERRPHQGGGNRWERPQTNERPPRDFDRSQRGGGNRPPFAERTERLPERLPERSMERSAPPAVVPPEREMTPPSQAPGFSNRRNPEFHDRRAVPERRHPSEDGSAAATVLLDQRVAVLVDVQNMYHSARKLHGRNLSYSKLLQNTVKGRKLTRAIAYLLDRDGVDQGGFLEHLSHSGFEVRRKELIERADGSRKGDWDLGIAVDAITLAEKVDVVMLVSGDGDFACLAQLLRHRGVKVEIASFRESTADALIHSADGFHPLGKDSLY